MLAGMNNMQGRKIMANRSGRPIRVTVGMASAAIVLAGCGSASSPRPADQPSHPSPPGRSTIYVVDRPTLIPIEAAQHKTGRPIVLPAGSAGVAIAPDRRTAYVTAGALVIPVDLATGAQRKPFAVPGISSPIAVGRDSSTGYLLHGSDIAVLNLRRGTIERSIVVPGIAIDSLLLPAKGQAGCVIGTTITTGFGTGPPVLERVDLATGRKGKRVTIPAFFASALAPDGRTAYLASGNLLVPVDVGTGKVGQAIKTPMRGIGAIAIATNGRTAYVGNLKPQGPHSGLIVPVDLAAGKALAAIHVPSYPYSITDIVIAQDQRTAFAAAYSAVIPINLSTRKVEPPIHMPDGAHAIILAP